MSLATSPAKVKAISRAKQGNLVGRKRGQPGNQSLAKGVFRKQVIPQKPRMTALRGGKDEHRAAAGEESQGH
jgi:hypothetical protein